MFGYVRPALDRLSPEDKELYQSAYCGLCHAMGKRHGWLARFTLNYDFTLLAVLHSSADADSCTRCFRCPVHPFRKQKRCLCGKALDRAADQSMILTWYKLSDDVADHGLIRGLPARFLRRLLLKGYKRAILAEPKFDQRVCEEMGRLSSLEAAKSPQLDRVADTFARILSAAAHSCDENLSRQRTMEQLLYHLGRWIYLIDAWDDLEDDVKKGRYNPLHSRFDGNAAGEREYVETTMTHSVRLVHAAANLLELGLWQPVVDNVIYVGLPAVQRAVLNGTWKELRKQGRNKNERSI